MISIKYLSNFWRTPEMPLIHCEIHLMLTWSSTCVITNSTGAGSFAINDAKLHVPVVILSTQDNSKLFEFQVISKLYTGSYLPNVGIKNHNVMINGENLFDQRIKNNKVTYKNIRKVAIGKGDDYTNGCLLDYPYFRDSYKLIDIDLSRQQALDANPRAIQQINFTANLDRAGDTRIYFILEESKETKLDFAQGTGKVL